MSRYDKEQKELLDISNALEKLEGRSWCKFRGDVINRRVVALLTGHTKLHGYTVVGPSVFIAGLPLELDALVVKKSCKPIAYTNSYKWGDVLCAIEIKKRGFFFKKVVADESVKQYFLNFKQLKVPLFYLTIKENKMYTKITKKHFKNSYFLNKTSGGVTKGEWRRFVTSISKKVS